MDDVTVQLFIDHAAAKLKTAPPVVKAELKGMVPSGPPLGELAEVCRNNTVLCIYLSCKYLNTTDLRTPHVII